MFKSYRIFSNESCVSKEWFIPFIFLLRDNYWFLLSPSIKSLTYVLCFSFIGWKAQYTILLFAINRAYFHNKNHYKPNSKFVVWLCENTIKISRLLFFSFSILIMNWDIYVIQCDPGYVILCAFGLLNLVVSHCNKDSLTPFNILSPLFCNIEKWNIQAEMVK